jgi:4-phospho-D-threonate 3-dehydrogenase / 4-phospho-D-erythronate 3-dehydrogenase
VRMKPIIAITIGDPTGIGPEVTAKALAQKEVWDCSRPLVVGDAGVMRKAAALVGGALSFRSIAQASEARFDPSTPDVLDLHNVDLATLQFGRVSAIAGKAAVEYVVRAIEITRAGQADAIATGPINKAALKAANIPYIGHTELFADLLGTKQETTMLATPGLRAVHVTRHVPFAKIAGLITRERVLDTIRLTHSGLQEMGIARPRLGVAALNPHGGDEGLMGREEIDAIAPAVEAARAEGIEAVGPIPADSIFFRAIHGEFDVVVAMYHDQGHIPIKTHGFERSITVTLGMPLIRTSVDHGTAFDIAWQGIASAESMVEAICLAAQLAVGHKSVA